MAIECTPPCAPNDAEPIPGQNAPCVTCGDGSQEGGADVESILLCDVNAEGDIVGTAIAVYEYDAQGNPSGPPTFVDPATGNPYVVQGTLQPCGSGSGSDCGGPLQFCFTSTSTGPVDHPGRRYEMTLPVNPGFAVESLLVDAVTSPANIVWEVDDPDGEQFRQALTTFIEGRVPAAATVTITNPNAGVAQVCGLADPMTIVIECVRLDQNPPNLIELVYNGGQDLIQNPAYNESPALNPPVSQGNYGFHLLAREDDPGPFPGFPPSGRALCTDTANLGWETNDVGRTFEIWGQDVRQSQGVVPTPRGTPVQEITSDGPPPGQRSTIWQTFTAPASGNFIIRLVHGARDAGEEHRLTLTPGDTNEVQGPGAIIDNVTTPGQVTNNGGNPPQPWTQFEQTIPLVGGQQYTLAFSSTNPAGGARGGLFTDMRAFIDRPGLRATAATDDDTCVVTVEETTSTSVCEYWKPQCIRGEIVAWQNVATGEQLTNAAFWAQVPAPSCCLPESSEGEGGSVSAGNLLYSYPICGIVGGIRQTLQRVVITDQSGGIVGGTILGTDGAPVTPDAGWTAGDCPADSGGEVLLPVCVQPDPGQPDIQHWYAIYEDATTTVLTGFRNHLGAFVPNLTGGAAVVACPDEVDQYDTAPVTACYLDGVPPNVVRYVTYERVQFNNTTHTEVLRERHWYNVATGDDTTVEPAGTQVDCGSTEVQVVESEELGCANGVPWSRRRTGFFDLQGQLIATVYTFVDSGGTEQQLPPAGFTLGDCPAERPETDTLVLCDPANGDQPVIVNVIHNANGTTSFEYLLIGGAPFAGDPNTLVVCPGGTQLLDEVDQQDTAPVAMCFDNAGVITRWHTFERVRFNNQTQAEVSRVRHWYNPVTGADVTAAPAGTVVDCKVFDVEVGISAGCADGEAWDRVARVVYDPVTGLPASITFLYIDSNETTQTTAPDGWRLGSCIGQRRLYTTHIETSEGEIRILSGYHADTITPGEQMELVSWSVRHRSGTVTVAGAPALDGGGAVTLDAGEVIEFDAGDDPRGTLGDSVTIDTTNGSARITYQYRHAEVV